MGVTLTTRISDELEKEVERISKEEHLDKSAVARRLLEEAVREYKIKKALKKYEKGELSLGKAAKMVGMGIREILLEMRKRDIHFQYSKKSLIEDFEAAVHE